MKDKDFANTTVLYFNGFKWNKSQWIENFLKACFRTYLKIAQNKDILLLNYFFACEKEQTEIVTKIIFAVLLIVSGIKIGPFFFVQTKWKTKEPQCRIQNDSILTLRYKYNNYCKPLISDQ